MSGPFPVYVHFWNKHKNDALSAMGLPPDLDVDDLHLIVVPTEIAKVGDNLISKCSWCDKWSLVGTKCCERCIYSNCPERVYDLRYYIDVYDDQAYRLLFYHVK